MKSFLTGSTLVEGLIPGDEDYVCFFETNEEMDEFFSKYNFIQASNYIGNDTRFVSLRDEMINYICTMDLELFHRFKAFSGVLSHLQIKDKKDRIELSKACLYFEAPEWKDKK